MTTLIPTPRAYLGGQRVPSFATVRLHLAGVSLGEVAAACGVTRPAVSMWFSGTATAPPRLRDALETLVGAQAADRILEAIPERKERP
jgi:transcriptional regulator with XRE-family HTH domain